MGSMVLGKEKKNIFQWLYLAPCMFREEKLGKVDGSRWR